MRLRAAAVLAVGTAVVIAAAYHQGRADGTADAKLEQLARQRDTVLAQLDTAASQADRATQAAVVTSRRSITASSVRDSARSRLVVTTDSSVSIDGAAPIPVPPLVGQIIRHDDQALAAALADAGAQMLRANSLAIQLDIEHRLRVNAEARLAIATRQAHPKCGRKCGVVLGALAAIGALSI